MFSRSLDSRLTGFLLLTVTVLGWGLNWPAIKFLLQEWPALFSRGVAGLAAAAILFGVARARRDSLAVPARAVPALIFASFTNVFAWMGFGTMMMDYLTISEGALLAYTMPIWASLFAWPVLGERPTPRGVIAIALGLAGILVLFGGQGWHFSEGKLLGVALALGAAILFALGSVLMKTPLPIAPIPLVAWQVGLGCAPMVILGLLFEHPAFGALSGGGWAILVYMTIGPMAACYLAWFAALRRLPASTATMGTLGVPVVGVIAGALTLGEPLGPRVAVAVVLTLSGVALALRKTKPRPVE